MGVFSAKRFAIQLIFIFVLFTLGSAILLGVPAAWLFIRQTEVQLDALVDQSVQTTVALFDNHITQTQDMAALLAERPTMNRLVSEEDFPALSQYLENLLDNADLDLILVCQNNQLMIGAGEDLGDDSCKTIRTTELIDNGQSSWLLTSALLDADIPGESWITVGQRANTILENFSQQSGMAYSLYTESGQMLSTTIDTDIAPYKLSEQSDESYQRINIGEESYIQAPVIMPVLGEYRLYGSLIDPIRHAHGNSATFSWLLWWSLASLAWALLCWWPAASARH